MTEDSNIPPLCAGHADWWFTGRDHLADDDCVVCAFVKIKTPNYDPLNSRDTIRKLNKLLDHYKERVVYLEGQLYDKDR